MLNKKWLLTALILGLGTSGYCLTLNDINLPKPPAYRVGISEIPENQYVEVKEDVTISQKITPIKENEDSSDISYSDLSIKRLSKEIAKELEYEEQDMVSDLTLLWQGAATKSDTIHFALYKLANPDADKPDKQTMKNILKTIASMSTLVGAGMANPVFAGASFMGSNIMGIMTQDEKALNYKYSKVGDADMIILIRKVEDLQQSAVNLYYDYMSARRQVELTTNLVQERQKRFNLAQSNNVSRELIVITDAYYRSAMDKQRTARSEFLSKRAALEQFVGNEAFTQFEQELYEREKKNRSGEAVEETIKTASIEQAYDVTVQNTQNYTSKVAQNNPEHESSPFYYGEKPEDENSASENFQNEQTNVSANKYYIHDDLSIDPNLDKLPALAPLVLEEEKDANIEPQNEEIQVNEKVVKPAKEKKTKVKKEKKQKVKTSKKSDKKLKEENTSETASSPVADETVEAVEKIEKPKKEKKEKKVKKEKTKEPKEKKVKQTPQKSKKYDYHQQPRKTYPKNSTKDLIFLHGKTKEEYAASQAAKAAAQTNTAQNELPANTQTQAASQNINPVLQNNQNLNLMPLDEILPPRNGHSIYQEEGIY